MTSYKAYDAGLPCKNPSCRSEGKPHPNCKCYGGMAEGGEVEYFCGKSQPHRRECKYFKTGGDVHAEDVPLHPDATASVSSYLAHGGMHSLLKNEDDSQERAIDRYNRSVQRGHKFFDAHVESLFGGKKPDTLDYAKSKEALNDWISKGGITQDLKDGIHNDNSPANFADGGEAKHPGGLKHNKHLGAAYPEHHVMLQETKGRVSQYLNSLKPQEHTQKLAFDDAPDNTQQKKSYDMALKTAAHPLSVLEEVRRGTIVPEHLQHLNGMYPELANNMARRLTKRITEAQLEGKKPPYHVRQGLSLMLGAPLSGDMAQPNIAAAQATFQAKKDAQQQGGAPQKKTSAIAKSSQSYLLPSQAAAERQQKQ